MQWTKKTVSIVEGTLYVTICVAGEGWSCRYITATWIVKDQIKVEVSTINANLHIPEAPHGAGNEHRDTQCTCKL